MTAAGSIQLLCFRLGERIFALDIMGIREILRNQKLTPVPHTPPHIAGVVNLRGALIPVVDPHRILGIPMGSAGAEDQKLVVIQACGKVAGVLVDQVLDVVSVDVEALTPVPGCEGGSSHVVMATFRKGEDSGGDVVVLLRLAMLTGTDVELAPETSGGGSTGP